MNQIKTFLRLLLFWVVFAIPNLSAQTIAQTYECNSINKRFVHLPVKTGAPKTWVSVNIDGVWQTEFEIELAPENPDFYATLEVGQWKGKKLSLNAENVTPGSKWISLTKMSDEMSDERLVYKEEYRPQFHFSPRRGWTNDPNGLVYYKGTYHLFFQHNPFGASWGNMTWGHAVSKDLFHWTEKPDAVLADKNGVVFSGSAVVDTKNSSGLQKHPKRDKNGNIINPPLVAFYTSTAANRGKGESAQSMVYSLDEGKTWIKYPQNPVIPHIIGGNRDPKVFWYEDRQNPSNPNSGHWVMALYLDGQDYALFSSKDLIHWIKVCDIKNLGCSECPDMFELPVDGNKQNTHWVFWGGDGKYLIGTFNGKDFIKESGPFTTKYGGNDYAAQSYSNIPATDGRRIQFSWMQGGEYTNMPFNQQFTVPRELSLRSTPEGIRLFLNPVKEIERLRIAKAIPFAATLQGVDKFIKVPNLKGELLDIELQFDLKSLQTSEGSNVFTTEIFEQKITYDLDTRMIELVGVKAPLAPVKNRIKLRLVIDRTSMELFANDGIIQIAKCFLNKDKVPANMTISGKKDMANVTVKVYQLSSVWRK
ncbi:MAG: glycoside hydrolase family 32 protein [Bacteroidota bacterium]|nr:glycoside hydrolase family 32 protein [Bacteroidota bacterium]